MAIVPFNQPSEGSNLSIHLLRVENDIAVLKIPISYLHAISGVFGTLSSENAYKSLFEDENEKIPAFERIKDISAHIEQIIGPAIHRGERDVILRIPQNDLADLWQTLGVICLPHQHSRVTHESFPDNELLLQISGELDTVILGSQDFTGRPSPLTGGPPWA